MSTLPEYFVPDTVPEPLGLYSHAARAGGLVFVAGQVGVRADGSLAGEDLASQVHQTFANIEAVLAAKGASLRNVVKFTTYLTGAEHIKGFYDGREEAFAGYYPDRQAPPNTLLVIDRLVHPEYLVEIEAIAWVG